MVYNQFLISLLVSILVGTTMGFLIIYIINKRLRDIEIHMPPVIVNYESIKKTD